jgi:hypothetical protein
MAKSPILEAFMFRKPIFAVILVLALVTLACGIRFPVTEVKTGPTETDDIEVPLPDTQKTIDLTFAFGAGTLTLNPGAEDALVTGEATYNVRDFKPGIIANDNVIRVEQGDLEISGIPTFDDSIKNDWDFKLADAPMRLTINAGAYVGRFELGDLSIENLKVADGAADVDLTFSKPNRIEMDILRYETGASDVTLSGLANANFAQMFFRSGAGSYTLDFTGELQRDATVSVESGISSLTIIVPEGVNAEVEFEGGLTNISLKGAWREKGGAYLLEGSGPKLTITIKMGAGDLVLRNP